MKRLLLFLLLCLATDPAIAENAPAVVSLSPAHTELICFLGCGAQLVGRSDGCDHPGSVRNLPVAGALGTPDPERLARLRPRLLITDTLRHAGLRQTLTAMGVETLILPLQRLQDYPETVLKLGERLGAAAPAAAEAERFRRFVEKRSAPPAADAPTVLFVVWHDPVIAAGGGTFAGDYIRLAGGINAAAEIDRPYFRPSAEWLVRRDPDLIVYPGGHGVAAAALPSYWHELRAVRNGHLYRPAESELYFRLSPRFDRAVGGLEEIIRQYRRSLAENPQPRRK